MNPQRPIYGSHSDTSVINLKHMVTELFGQMRDPGDAGGVSPRSSSGSIPNGPVTKNVGFLSQNSSEHLPWSSSAVTLPGNCNSNLMSDGQGSLVRSSSNASALTSLCVDLSPSDSHFFEVLYIGKVRISQRKVPETLIDDALQKFAVHEAEKASKRRHSLLSSTGTSLYDSSSADNLTDDKKSESSENFCKKFTSPSTTPLEPDKGNIWKSFEALSDETKENKQIDDEFDLFTKERIEKVKKPNQLETIHGGVNAVVNNLGTVKEDEEKSDIYSSLSKSGNSITELSHETNDPELDKIKNVVGNTNIIDLSPRNLKDKDDFDKLGTDKVLDKETIVDPLSKIVEDDKKRKEDINFDEIKRIPKGLLEVNNPKKLPENKQFLRDRSASIGTLSTKTPISQLTGEQNRTMLFQVGRSELRLISPDRKQILLHRAFKDVASCVLGRSNKDHFGFVCRETNDTYACYVFKCESDSVAGEVINAIRQAFVAHAELLKRSREKSPNMTCEHCPMLWYHRLCHDVEGMTDKRTHAFILRRLEQLPDDEQDLIVTKYQGGTNHMFETSDHNAFLMMLLRAHCEAKQHRHVHDTAENRSEFLNQYLGGSTIFMKAKRSLSSGFDHLLKRKLSKDDGLIPHLKKDTSPIPVNLESYVEQQKVELPSPDTSHYKTMANADTNIDNDSPQKDSNILIEEKEGIDGKDDNESGNSPMMDIFLKVSDSRSTPAESGIESDATWRQAIYEKVIKPTDLQPDVQLSSCLLGKALSVRGRRSNQELRQLWKMAINQTLLLVRMEKENEKLKEREESSAVRRIKLEYTELGVCDAGVSLMWDSLLSRDSSQPMPRVDKHMLTQAVIQGVPRMSRGAIWYFLAEQASLRSPPPDTRDFPLYHTPYKALLGGLTKHQHAILIDLGRTFPKHSYFASALGPGQLALYNILKAYSLLDPDVGYCQGLSFVAGVLLLHMEESEAFTLLRHLMFRRGLRKQYLPDMSALQVQLYQLSRLVRDHEPELHAKLESVEVSPALYAAPWMLTLFTSQFPLGLVVRVFDLIFLESLDVVFSVSLALLSVHKDGLMLCESCEEAAEYLKHKLPDMNRAMYEKVMKKVHSLDISRQLSEYSVEYAVLREEMPRLASLTEQNRKLQADNNKMSEDLDSAMEAITNYQKIQASLENSKKVMEQQLTLLSRYITVHQKDMPVEIKKIVQDHCKKLSFSSKIFSNKFNSEESDDLRKPFKQGLSSPNLFAKINQEKEQNRNSPETEKEKRFIMKKSQSVHSGLVPKNYPLKVVEERDENRNNKTEEDKKRSQVKRERDDINKKNERDDDRKEIYKSQSISESLKELAKSRGIFGNTHEQIRQEMLFEKQLKHDFDENLKKLDEKLNPKSYIDDVNIFQGRKTMSLNLATDEIGSKVDRDFLTDRSFKKADSGFVTPITPDAREDARRDANKNAREDASSIISHPLSDCDVDIKFDGQSTKLKQIRPLKHVDKNA